MTHGSLYFESLTTPLRHRCALTPAASSVLPPLRAFASRALPFTPPDTPFLPELPANHSRAPAPPDVALNPPARINAHSTRLSSRHVYLTCRAEISRKGSVAGPAGRINYSAFFDACRNRYELTGQPRERPGYRGGDASGNHWQSATIAAPVHPLVLSFVPIAEPTFQRRLTFSRRPAEDEIFYAYVLVQLWPVNSATTANESPILPFLGCPMAKARVPRQGNGNCPTVREFCSDAVICNDER